MKPEHELLLRRLGVDTAELAEAHAIEPNPEESLATFLQDQANNPTPKNGDPK